MRTGMAFVQRMGEQQKLDSHEWTKDKREELVCQQITTIKPRQEK
jgi:hypothetical protein